MKPVKILLSGEGGQGIQTIAKILTESAFESGFNVAYIPSFGVEQRGTPSVAFLTISKEDIHYPRFDRADYAIIFQMRAIAVAGEYISNETKVIFDSSTIHRYDLPKHAIHVFGTPVTQYAKEKFNPKSFNVIIAGKLSKMLGLPSDQTWTAVEKKLGKKFKTEEIRKSNKDAFEFGLDLVFEVSDFTEPTFMPSKETVFVKGFGKKGEIVPKRCKGCGICIEKCPTRALRFGELLGVFATPVPEVDLEKCIACGNCRRFCPDSAINMEKEK